MINMIEFTRSTGDTVMVNSSDVRTIETTPTYTVLQSEVRTNPGEVLTKVVYNNPRKNVGGRGMSSGMSSDFTQYSSREMMEEETGMDDGSGIETMEEMGAEGRESGVASLYGGRSNPPTSGAISWRNLRLQSAIDSSKKIQAFGATRQAIRKLSNIGAIVGRINQNTSIRPYSEMLLLATAENWFDYIRNMNPLDVSAELSAEVSPQDQLSIYGFIKEWENDPSHRAFRRRVNQGADINSEFAKGQIAYDIMTSKGPDPMKGSNFATHRYDKMFSLALDILKSIRFNTYNYYTLNSMHSDEGDRVFMDFRSRYIPLGAADVEMIQEMQTNIAGGKSYAFQTTASQDQAIEADMLMRKCVSAYQVGDTRTCRSILDVLMAHPFNYKPMSTKLAVAHAARGGESAKVKFDQGEIFRVTGSGKKNPLKNIDPKYLEGNMAFVSISKKGTGGIENSLKDGKLGEAKNAGDAQLILHKSYFDTTPVGIITAKGNQWVVADYSEFVEGGKKTFEDKKQKSQRSKLQQAVKGNPKGRGKFLFMEIHPKSQLTMKRGSGEEKHGQSKDTAKWTKGLNKHFPGIKLVQVGKLKATGEDAPFRIRLPISHFKPITHPTKGYKTIGMKKGDKKLQATWQKIVDTYGMPKMSPTKGTYYRFIVDKKERGTYYDGVRRKTGKAKASR
tara:strand:+ start:194 stop:2218 length:2025 start_codon:yes stop_codon:yes gene_type:complete